MDHHHHETHATTGHMMKMFFHFDLGDTVLFQGVVLDTVWSTFVACFVFFTLATLYEGLKCYREYLIKRNLNTQRYNISIIGHGSDSPNGTATNGGGEPTVSLQTGSNRRSTYAKVFSGAHLLQSPLHVLQVAISYTLMLGFMTFNGWICISILLGAGFGYFVFCWRKLTVVDVTEHCH